MGDRWDEERGVWAGYVQSYFFPFFSSFARDQKCFVIFSKNFYALSSHISTILLEPFPCWLLDTSKSQNIRNDQFWSPATLAGRASVPATTQTRWTQSQLAGEFYLGHLPHYVSDVIVCLLPRPPTSSPSAPLCSGRGSCECGKCSCRTPQTVTGEFCECDDTSCDR